MPLPAASRSRIQASLAAAIALGIAWRYGSGWTAALAATLGLLAALAWIAPARYAPVQRALDRGAHALLVAFTWIALGAVYFALFTPLRVWRALTLNDPLGLRRRASAPTYFQPLRSRPPRHFERQF